MLLESYLPVYYEGVVFVSKRRGEGYVLERKGRDASGHCPILILYPRLCPVLNSQHLLSGTTMFWNLDRCRQLGLRNLKFGFQRGWSHCLHRCHLSENLENASVQKMGLLHSCQSPSELRAFRSRTRSLRGFGVNSQADGVDLPVSVPAFLCPFLPYIPLFQEQRPSGDKGEQNPPLWPWTCKQLLVPTCHPELLDASRVKSSAQRCLRRKLMLVL